MSKGKARQLAVLAGGGKGSTAPAWSPGQKVPAGYMIVFGRLVPTSEANGTLSELTAHKATTAAHNASTKANRSDDPKDHHAAVEAHAKASSAHFSLVHEHLTQSLNSGLAEHPHGAKHRAAADEHATQMLAHMKAHGAKSKQRIPSVGSGVPGAISGKKPPEPPPPSKGAFSGVRGAISGREPVNPRPR
jgi:hypothetical protein